jgi:uncharacterized membrane protein
MFSYLSSIVYAISPYVKPFYDATVTIGYIYGAYLGYKASVSAPNYKKLDCIIVGMLVGGVYVPSAIITAPFSLITGFPKLKITYNNGVIVNQN